MNAKSGIEYCTFSSNSFRHAKYVDLRQKELQATGKGKEEHLSKHAKHYLPDINPTYFHHNSIDVETPWR